jgi:O-Antigen ligase
MIGGYQARIAEFFIWTFFLLVLVPTTTMATVKFGVPLRPVLFFAIIAGGLFASAVLVEPRLPSFRGARVFFVGFAVLVILGGVMYRGEAIGPDFGAPVLGAFVPSNISYVVWPVFNLVAAAAMFLLAHHERFQRAIAAAAFVALIVQVVTMEADMWWPALFGDANGRGGGVAQNANVAAMLVVSVASLLLPSRLGERFNAFSPYAMPLMIAAVLLSQSRSGAIFAAGYLFCFAVSAWRGSPRWPRPAFTVGLLAVLAGTVFLSPVLNPTPEQIDYREKNRDALALAHEKAGELPTSPLETPLTLPERLEARRLIDGSAELRRKAFSFFLDVLKDHPQGLGTGFTNKFQTGPHNAFLKLAVDEGIFAAIAF